MYQMREVFPTPGSSGQNAFATVPERFRLGEFGGKVMG